MFKIFFILCSFLVTSAFAIDCVGDCHNSSVPFLDLGTQDNISMLNQVSESNKIRVDLAEAKIAYSSLGIGVGRAQIFITIRDGQLVDLNIDAKVGILGVNSEIKKKVTIDQLMLGQPLEFFMEGASRPTLRVRPGPSFSKKGGTATLEIWDGEKYIKEIISISDRIGNRYKIYHGNVQTRNEVTGLSINMFGSSISRMYVGRYKIKTR